MAVTFTESAAKRIAEVVRRVERTPRNLAGERPVARPSDTSFWALITGNDIMGLRYHFVRVIPDAGTDRADFRFETGLAYRIAGEEPEAGYAREASGVRGVPIYSVVKAEFIGYDADEEPAYLFQWAPPPEPNALPPHDHRDNLNGGFAFSTYHPGTSLPQMPWAL